MSAFILYTLNLVTPFIQLVTITITLLCHLQMQVTGSHWAGPTKCPIWTVSFSQDFEIKPLKPALAVFCEMKVLDFRSCC